MWIVHVRYRWVADISIGFTQPYPQADLGQMDTLQLAKQVNEYQRKLQDTTRKMMALVSELSMNQVGLFCLVYNFSMSTMFLLPLIINGDPS